MSTKRKQEVKDTIYFCTFTCFEWIPLFEITKLYDFIYKWFDILKSKDIKIIGYVIMPNHMHLIAFIPEKAATIDKVIGNGKRFMAYEITKRLKEMKFLQVLQRLRDSVSEKDKLKNKLHNVFQPSFDVKALVTEHFIIQKLNYIHANPVRGKWNLAEDYTKYPYSSAGFYELDDFDGYKITHYAEAYSDLAAESSSRDSANT
jgi:putative transposase